MRTQDCTQNLATIIHQDLESFGLESVEIWKSRKLFGQNSAKNQKILDLSQKILKAKNVYFLPEQVIDTLLTGISLYFPGKSRKAWKRWQPDRPFYHAFKVLL